MTPGHGPKGDCWVYTGAKHKFGYGMINNSDSKESDVVTTHVFSWELENGPVPDGQSVLHECDHPPCMRPDHLFLGTQKDNVEDMINKGRQLVGEDAGMAKLTEKEVREILADSRSSYELAPLYGVCPQNIRRIRAGKTWTHLS
jgi:hypothetical protein